jgi:anti-sigma factor RsiW
MICDRSTQVHAYHDGELPADQVAAFEEHLQTCAECRELLAALRAMSQRVAAAPMVEISDIAIQRLRQQRYVMPDAGVMRIAGWLTAAAAAVLIAALPMWHREGSVNPSVASADVLDMVAVSPPSDGEGTQHEVVALAQWMRDDLSVSERR